MCTLQHDCLQWSFHNYCNGANKVLNFSFRPQEKESVGDRELILFNPITMTNFILVLYQNLGKLEHLLKKLLKPMTLCTKTHFDNLLHLHVHVHCITETLLHLSEERW